MRTALVTVLLSATLFGQTINLPSSKKLEPVPGSPQKLNSLPSKIVLSPDGRYAAILNQGYGTALSEGHQSIAIYDIDKMQLRDFPDARLGPKAQQTYYLGLSFSSKGDEIYASIASLTDPEGKKKGSSGNGIAVYSFHGGQLVPARFLKIPLQTLAPGKRFTYGNTPIPAGEAIPYPAGLAVVPPDAEHPHDRLLVANNLSDNAVLIDAITGETLHTFDLSTKDFVPAVFPHSVVVAPEGKKAWVSLWNSATVAEIDLIGLSTKSRQLAPEVPNSSSSPHASFMTFSMGNLYVGLANKDETVIVTPNASGSLDLSLPRGAYLSSLAALPNGDLLLSASGVNAIYEIPACLGTPGCKRPVHRYPTQWYPTAIAVRGDDVLIVNGKGVGTGPNNGPVSKSERRRKFPYIASLLNGSLQHTRLSTLEAHAKGLNEQVVRSNRLDEKPVRVEWDAKVEAKIPAKLRARGPIRHVIYIIKENRTYDQVFGDLGVGNGDKSLL